MIARGKRVLSLMLVLCMLVLLMPTGVLAEGETVNNLWAEGGKPSDMNVTVKNRAGGFSPWNDKTVNGQNCIASTVQGKGSGKSRLSVAFTVPEGKTAYVMFDYAVSSETNRDRFKVYDCEEIDSNSPTIINTSGNTSATESDLPWKTAQYAYGEGTHTLTFAYDKGASGDVGLDTAYLKNLKISYNAVFLSSTLTINYNESIGRVYIDGELAKSGERMQRLAHHDKIVLEAVDTKDGHFSKWQRYNASTQAFEDYDKNSLINYTFTSDSEDCILNANFTLRRPVTISANDYNDDIATLQYKESGSSEWIDLPPLTPSGVMYSQQYIDLQLVAKEGYKDSLYCTGASYQKRNASKEIETVSIIAKGATTGSFFLGDNGDDSDYTAVIDVGITTTGLVDIEGFSAVGVKGAQTHGNYPWTLADNVYVSGNKGWDSSLSTMKLDLCGPGTLVFDYKVSSDKDDYLCFVQGEEPTRTYGLTGDNTTAGVVKLGSGSDNVSWKQYAVVIDKPEGEDFSVYIVYAKDISGNLGEDLAWIRNIAYVNGEAKVTVASNDTSRGTVTMQGWVEGDVYNCGTSLTIKAQPTGDNKFYGWVNTLNNKLLSTDAEYTFPVTEAATIVAMFAAEGTYAARSDKGFYEDLATAINEADSGTVRVLKTTALSANATLKEGVTLLLPFSESDETGYKLNGDKPQVHRPTIATQPASLTVTVPEGMSLDIKGKVIVGGVRHSVEQDAQGQTSGDYAALTVNGSLNVLSGGYLDVNGLVSGGGTTALKNGGTMRMPYLLLDYSGGTNTAALYNANSFPFGQYCTMNVQTPFTMEGGGRLIGSTSLFFYGSSTTQDVDLVAENSGLIYLPVGSTLTASYNKNQRIAQKIGNIELQDFGKTSITISGGATAGGFKISGYGSENMYLNIPYTYDINLTNGTYTMPYYYRVMPGANLNVANGAELVVKGGLQAVDGWRSNAKSNKNYPQPDILAANGFAKNGCLTVNGTLTIGDGAEFGGIVSTTSNTAKINTGKGAVLNKQNYFGGSTGGYVDNYCEYALPARINVNGSLYTLLPASSYQSSGDSTWTLESFTMQAHGLSGSSTVTINQTMHGDWSTPVTLSLDLNGAKLEAATQTQYDVISGAAFNAELISLQLKNPTWDYNTFKGWYTAKTDGEKVELSGKSFTENTTLYAQWDMHVCTYDADDIVVTEPTCTEDGYTTNTCKVCKVATVTDEKDALGHDWKAATATAPKTCSRCKLTEGEPLGGAAIVNKTYYSETDSSRFSVSYHDTLEHTIVVTKTDAGKGYTYLVKQTVGGVESTVTMLAGGSVDTTASYTYDEGATQVAVIAVKKGDVNLDNKTNIRDVSALRLVTANQATLESEYAKAVSDINNDGKTNIRDVSALRLVTANQATLN